MSEVRAVVFDLFNTLLLIKKPTISPYGRLFDRLNISKELRPKLIHLCMTRDLPTLLRFLNKVQFNFSDSNLRFLIKDLSESQEEFEDALQKQLANVRLQKYVEYTLSELKNGGIQLGLVSNLTTQFKKPFYSLGLDAFIQDPVFSCDVGFKKPEPEIYKIVLERLQVPAENVLFVGDRYENDVVAPKKAGMQALHLLTTEKVVGDNSINCLSEVIEYVDTGGKHEQY